MNLVKSPLQAALLLACTLPAQYAAAEHREQGAHVHGAAQMNVVLDGNNLLIDLDSPTANLVGFEHAPRNQAEEAAQEQAVTRLQDATVIFSLPQAAQCEVEEVEMESALLGQNRHDDHNEAHTSHEPHEGPDKAHEHHDGHEHDSEEGYTHADMAVSYLFHCTHPQALDGITVNLFKLFPAMEEIAVQLITPTGQGAADLTADAPYLRF